MVLGRVIPQGTTYTVGGGEGRLSQEGIPTYGNEASSVFSASASPAIPNSGGPAGTQGLHLALDSGPSFRASHEYEDYTTHMRPDGSALRSQSVLSPPGSYARSPPAPPSAPNWMVPEHAGDFVRSSSLFQYDLNGRPFQRHLGPFARTNTGRSPASPNHPPNMRFEPSGQSFRPTPQTTEATASPFENHQMGDTQPWVSSPQGMSLQSWQELPSSPPGHIPPAPGFTQFSSQAQSEAMFRGLGSAHTTSAWDTTTTSSSSACGPSSSFPSSLPSSQFQSAVYCECMQHSRQCNLGRWKGGSSLCIGCEKHFSLPLAA